ncbi:MAG: chorismate mutase [Ileibacterium sp.]|nr:chorismate mutase [Ileibacterium sp.]
MNELEAARQIINEADEQIAALYQKRMEAARKVAAYKKDHNLPIFDPAREKTVIERNLKFIEHPEYEGYYEEFLHFLMDQSKSYQKSLLSAGTVAYAGIEGAFGHMVSERLFPENNKLPLPNFEEVIEAVLSKKAEYGVIPLENNNSGLVGEVMDALQKYPIYIVQAVDQTVDQCLLGLPEATLKDIEWVYSKDQALAQAKDFLDSLDVETVCYPNTAMAAQFVAKEGDIHKAAIGARENAALYGLKVLARRIEANETNTTRFLVVAREPNRTMEDYVALIATVSNKVGSLYKVIDILARYNIDMDCIQSRPLKGRKFEYFFYIQCAGHMEKEQLELCMRDLQQVTTSIQFKGSYNIKKRKE